MFRCRRIRRNLVTLSAHLLRREIALGLIVLIATPFGGWVPVFAQQTSPAPVTVPQTSGTSSSQPSSGNAVTGDQTPVISTRQDRDTTTPSNVPKSSPAPQQSGPQAPLGTAVAPYEKGIGVAASRPAGAVIAPAKQRRTRSFVIKLGVLIGACAAVGTVVALSNASPSQPH
jgi:hypothetical protein